MTANISNFGDLGSLSSGRRTYLALVGRNMGNAVICLDLSLPDLYEMSEVPPESQRKLNDSHAQGLANHTLVGLIASQINKDRAGGKIPNEDIKKFEIIQNQIGKSPYAVLQPIVCNIQNCDPGGANLKTHDIVPMYEEHDSVSGTKNLKKFESIGQQMVCVELGHEHKLRVIDGQHRREGFDQARNWLKKVLEDKRYPKMAKAMPQMSDGRIDTVIWNFWSRVWSQSQSEAYMKANS